MIPGFQGSPPKATSRRSAAAAPIPRRSRWPSRSKADRCDIYTDVEGVFTTDPRIVPRARKLSAITYEEMLELARSAPRSCRPVRSALQCATTWRCRCFRRSRTGPERSSSATTGFEELNMEKQLVTGIAHDKNEARVTLTGLPDKPGRSRRDLRAARQGQHQRRHDRPERRRDRRAERPHLHRSDRFSRPGGRRARKGQRAIGFEEIVTDTDVVKVSAVGIGMRSNAGIAAKMFETLAERGINILAISTSEIKVSVLLPRTIPSLPCACFTLPSASMRSRRRERRRADRRAARGPRVGAGTLASRN